MSDREHNPNLVSQTPYQPNSASSGRSIGDKPPRNPDAHVPAPWGRTHAHPTADELTATRAAPAHPTVPARVAAAPAPGR